MIAFSYTLEATFAGPNFGELKQTHLNIGNLLEIGSGLCEAIAQFTLTPDFARDFNVPLEAIAMSIPSEFDVNTNDLANGDDIDNDDVSSGSDDEDTGAIVPIKSSDSLDEFIAIRQLSLAVKATHGVSKRTNASKEHRSDRPNDLGKRPQESLRLMAGKSAMAVIKRKTKRNSISGDSRRSVEESVQKFDGTIMSQSYHKVKEMKTKGT